MAYSLRTDKTWAQTDGELQTEFSRWGVRDYEVRSLGRGSRANYQSLEDRRVTIRWTTREGREMRLEMADQERAVDNLRVLFLAIQAMRLNEVRGIGKVLADAYMQLAAPKAQRDPWEVLGLRPGATADEIDAMYRVKAKAAHPDAGGSDEAMAELNDARDRAKAALA